MVTTGDNAGPVLTPPFPIADLIESQRALLLQTPSHQSSFRELLAAGLPPLANNTIFSVILGISPKLLYAMAHVPERYYREFSIKKKSGGTRQIATPRVFLKTVQKWILLNILYREELPSFVTGFVRKRGILANARIHKGRKYLAKVDLADFFPTVSFSQVLGVYRQFGFPRDVRTLLSGLSTLRGHLPQGAPTSPFLANLVFLPADKKIESRAISGAISYSRYADDLTFSSDKPISKGFLEYVEATVLRAGFRINKTKSRESGPGQRLITTGLVVNEKVHPPRRLRRQLRARFHQAANHPSRFKKSANELLGWAAYVHMYDPSLGDDYLKIARKVLGQDRA
jgi:RNA-directed DNA polymerase